MAVREFLRDAPADDLITATGALSGMTHGTVGFIVKLLDVTDFNDLFYLHDSGGTNIGGVGVDDSSANVYWWDGSTNPGGPSLTANVWLLVVARKATGTATARFSVYNYSTDTWSHANASGTTGNFTAPGVSGDIRFSFESTFGLCELRIALRAAWSNSLPWSADTTGDSAIEAAGLETSAANWDAESPSMGQLFNQAATTTPIEDWTGGGADETTLTGTTVVNGDDPPGFDFSLSTATDLDGTDTTQAQTATAAALTQTHELSADATVQAQSATAAALTQTHELAADSATQTQSATAAALTQVHELQPTSAVQGQTATTAALVQTHELAAADAGQAQTADTVAVSEGVTLSPASTVQAQEAAAAALTQIHELTAADVLQAQSADAATLMQLHELVAASVVQAQIVALPALTLGEITTPASRTFTVQAEDRTFSALAEDRTFEIVAESRRFAVT